MKHRRPPTITASRRSCRQAVETSATTQERQSVARTRRRQPAEVPPEEVAELKRRREAGESLPQLMETFDGSYRTLRAVLDNAGVERSGRQQPLPTPQALINASAEGKTVREAAEIAGVRSVSTAHRMLERSVDPMRPKRSVGRRALPTPQALLDARAEGKSVPEAAKIAGVPASTAYRMLGRSGDPMRPKGQPPQSPS